MKLKPTYAVSVAFAIALHATLLLGFHRADRGGTGATAPVRPEKPTPKNDPEPMPLIDCRTFDEPIETAGPKGSPDADRPTLPEPLTRPIDSSLLTFPAPTAERPAPTTVVTHISAEVIGQMSGIEGVMGPDRDRPVGVSSLDKSPRTRAQTAPLYPFEAKNAGLSGEVLVGFSVNERGEVFDARVVSSSNRVFEEASLRAVMKWRFEPGRRHGRLVPFRMEVPVMFNLNDN